MTNMQGMRTPAEIAPLTIREYLTDRRSMSSRVVLERITPPNPEPAFARPYRCIHELVSKLEVAGGAYLCQAQPPIEPMGQKWL